MIKRRVDYRTRTPSIWPFPDNTYFRFSRFLKRIEDKNLPKTLAVLDCSDGNYVLPAAKRGFEVLAIDIDSVALYGGVTKLSGKDVEITGLINRLEAEGIGIH